MPTQFRRISDYSGRGRFRSYQRRLLEFGQFPSRFRQSDGRGRPAHIVARASPPAPNLRLTQPASLTNRGRKNTVCFCLILTPLHTEPLPERLYSAKISRALWLVGFSG